MQGRWWSEVIHNTSAKTQAVLARYNMHGPMVARCSFLAREVILSKTAIYDLLKNYKATKQCWAASLVRQRNAIEMAFRCRDDDGPHRPDFNDIWSPYQLAKIFDPLINYVQKKKWTPSEKNFLDPCMVFITCKHRPDATDRKRKCLLVTHIV